VLFDFLRYKANCFGGTGMVGYGFGVCGVLGYLFLSSVGFGRNQCWLFDRFPVRLRLKMDQPWQPLPNPVCHLGKESHGIGMSRGGPVWSDLTLLSVGFSRTALSCGSSISLECWDPVDANSLRTRGLQKTQFIDHYEVLAGTS
jgi:hypothetical protein